MIRSTFTAASLNQKTYTKQNSNRKAPLLNNKVIADSVSLSGKHKSVSFGYNAELNRELINKANNNGNAIIRELAKYCNKIEDRVVQLEEKLYQGNEKVSQQLIDKIANNKLMPLKQFLAEKTEKAFPELKYKEKEAAKYFEEAFTLEDATNTDPTWRAAMVNMLLPKQKNNKPQDTLTNNFFMTFSNTRRKLKDAVSTK